MPPWCAPQGRAQERLGAAVQARLLTIANYDKHCCVKGGSCVPLHPLGLSAEPGSAAPSHPGPRACLRALLLLALLQQANTSQVDALFLLQGPTVTSCGLAMQIPAAGLLDAALNGGHLAWSDTAVRGKGRSEGGRGSCGVGERVGRDGGMHTVAHAWGGWVWCSYGQTGGIVERHGGERAGEGGRRAGRGGGGGRGWSNAGG